MLAFFLGLAPLLPVDWSGWVSILARTPAEFGAGVLALFLDIALDGIVLYDTVNYASGRLLRVGELIHKKGLSRE